MTQGIVSVTVSAAFGFALAVAAAVLGVWRRLPPVVMATTFLAILALGAVETFGLAIGVTVVVRSRSGNPQAA